MSGEGVDDDVIAAAESNEPEREAAAALALTDESIRAAAKARQMAGLRKGSRRRKRKFTRTLKGPKGENKKRSSFDYQQYRELNTVSSAATSQEVRATVGATKANSPPKSVVKWQLKAALVQNDIQNKKIAL